jgi:hypothetical protein
MASPAIAVEHGKRIELPSADANSIAAIRSIGPLVCALLAILGAIALMANGAGHHSAASPAGEPALTQYPLDDGAVQPCAFRTLL